MMTTYILQQKLRQCSKIQKPQHKVTRKKVSLKETYLACIQKHGDGDVKNK
jgi:hypothetical protein